MTNEEPEVDEEKPDIEINLSNPDAVAYGELVDGFGAEMIEADL